jgi:hypothetical protein
MAAPHIGSLNEVSRLTKPSIRAKATRLGCATDSFDLPIARAMLPKSPWLYLSWRASPCTCVPIPPASHVPGS